MQWVSWLQLLAPFTGKWWIPEEHIPPRCYIPWCPTLQSHAPRSWLEHPTALGLRGCDCFVWVWGVFLTQKPDNFTNSFLDAFLLCLPSETPTFDHVLRSCMLPCKLRNYFQVYSVGFFCSLRKLRGLCSKYPDIRYLQSPPYFVPWKHKSPFCLLTLVGLSQWFEKELNVCSTAHQTEEGTFTKGGQGHHWACSHHLQALLNVSLLARFPCVFLFPKGHSCLTEGECGRAVDVCVSQK